MWYNINITARKDAKKTMTQISFKNWLIKFQSDANPIGDLSRDISKDSQFPNSNNREIILKYLQAKNPKNGVIETFKKAWQAYLLTR